MKLLRQKTLKPVSLVLALFMLIISGPFQSVYAALIGTEAVLDSARGQEARDYLSQLLAREDVQNALVAQGIDPAEAKARVGSLSDEEAIHAAEKFDQMPAASGFLETLLIIAFLVFIILLVTDIAGYTDIFPFVKPVR
jgi:hypothetical protein